MRRTEINYIFEDINEDDSTEPLDILNISSAVSRSGRVRSSAVNKDVSTQTETYFPRPEIRNVKNCTEEIKSTCVEVWNICSKSHYCGPVCTVFASPCTIIEFISQKKRPWKMNQNLC